MYARRILELLVVLLDSSVRVGHVGDDESALLVAIHHRVNRLARVRQGTTARELKQALVCKVSSVLFLAITTYRAL